MQTLSRTDRLLPDGVPKYIRLYDNGGSGSNLNGSVDRFTCVFTGNYTGRDGCDYISMSANPHHPSWGFCQHGWHDQIIDRPGYSHLGKAIAFTDLPEACQQVVLSDYKNIWDLS